MGVAKEKLMELGVAKQKVRSQTSSQTVQPTVRKKRQLFYFAVANPPGLQILFLTFTMLWMCPVKTWSEFGRINILYK